MKEEFKFLNHFPFEDYYTLCKQYLESRFNWDGISEEISRNGVSYFDVSDVVQLFTHLELDENYKLFCYLGKEWHGIWGRIAAIKNGDNLEPTVDSEKEFTSILFHGRHFELPESAIPPMD